MPTLTPIPTFTGIDNVTSRLRRSFDEIVLIVVERVVDRNKNERVAAVDLSPAALRAFLPGREATSVCEGPAAVPTPDEMRSAVLAWLHHTFAAHMGGAQERLFKVGLWRPKGEGLAGSARVTVSGLPIAPAPQTWRLVMPDGTAVFTHDPALVAAHQNFLLSASRGLLQLGMQANTTLALLVRTSQTTPPSEKTLASARAVCELQEQCRQAVFENVVAFHATHGPPPSVPVPK